MLDTEQDVDGDAADVVGSFKELVHYAWTADKQVPVGARLCTSLKLLPLQRLAISTIQLTLQEKSTTNATHNPVSRRWQLLKLQSLSGESLIPRKLAAICSTAQSKESLLPDLLSAAELSRANVQCPRDEFKTDQKDSKNCAPAIDNAASMLDNQEGPWSLAWNLRVPSCRDTAINLSVQHAKSVVEVKHQLVLLMVIEDIDKGVSVQVELARPITILSSFMAEPGASLPCYWCDHGLDHPYNGDLPWRTIAAQGSEKETSRLPAWFFRILGAKHVSCATNGTRPAAPVQALSYTDKGMLWLQLTSQDGLASAEQVVDPIKLSTAPLQG